MTSIEWTDKTWNPVRGCSIVSPGCVNCYAMRQAHRFSGEGQAYHGLTKRTGAGPQWTGQVVCDEAKLLEPLSWRKPARIFVNSMSDLFHEAVPDAFIDRVFAVMALAPHHTFQVLTKRPKRMRAFFEGVEPSATWLHAVGHLGLPKRWHRPLPPDGRMWIPLPNVWLGVSCENQQTADERIPLLLQTPAAIRWVSAEPLLAAVNLRIDGDAARLWNGSFEQTSAAIVSEGKRAKRLDWVVVGGESGAGARPFDLAWGRSIVRQCQAAGVACFVKQLGAKPSFDVEELGDYPLNFRSRKGGDPAEWPEDLRVRDYPTVGAHR